ncbi:hypothetical protein FGO68_gene14200 [Halteria grandinella]|uniref:Uncharacterized protein n=1 Tax=Halteria grandinella TaxID=5974 RepID=A0A8J8NWD9_HALGN|nr:hypothetical protein FGO68_gene14200 [Halteria grandinella]
MTTSKKSTTPTKDPPPPPGTIKSLDFNCLHTLLTTEDKESLKGRYFTVQILSLKDMEAEKAGTAAAEGRSEKDRNKAVKYKQGKRYKG